MDKKSCNNCKFMQWHFGAWAHGSFCGLTKEEVYFTFVCEKHEEKQQTGRADGQGKE